MITDSHMSYDLYVDTSFICTRCRSTSIPYSPVDVVDTSFTSGTLRNSLNVLSLPSTNSRFESRQNSQERSKGRGNRVKDNRKADLP